MKAVRNVYRDDIVQPLLLALIGFQILSGAALLRRRLMMPNDFLGTLQTMCGAHIGVYPRRLLAFRKAFDPKRINDDVPASPMPSRLVMARKTIAAISRS
jgi:hypothetical protein